MGGPGNTAVSPAIGIVVAATWKIGFGPDWAPAGTVWVAAPASASALDASMVLRSRVFMGIFPVSWSCWTACLAPHSAPGKTVLAETKKARAPAGLLN